jgi:hypothetical protein
VSSHVDALQQDGFVEIQVPSSIYKKPSINLRHPFKYSSLSSGTTFGLKNYVYSISVMGDQKDDNTFLLTHLKSVSRSIEHNNLTSVERITLLSTSGLHLHTT